LAASDESGIVLVGPGKDIKVGSTVK